MKKLFSILIAVISCTGFVQSQSETNERAKWFVEARYGMFIHWGVYSGAEGIWKGEKIRHDNDYSEWIFYRNQIEKGEYLELLERFDWNEIDTEEWVILAKKSGMKYITLTAKHHDGFALWDSKVSEYDLGDNTNPKRDIVKELAVACKKHGIKFGLYYSHWIDWEHKYGWDHRKEIYGITNAEYDQYWQEKVIPQIRELLTNYGEISMLWFDMWINHSKAVVSKEQLLQLKSIIREIQPNCLVNSRLGLSIEEDSDIDYKTLGDNRFGTEKYDFPWQSPGTVAHSWGYHALDNQFKSTTTLLKSLINNVSLNGNFMLNIGPSAKGDVQHEVSQRLLEMGKWLNVNGESIYGAGAFDLREDQHDWGRITCKKTDNGFKLYLHVFNWPLNRTLNLTGISEAPNTVYLLADKQKSNLNYTQNNSFTEIELPALRPDPYVSVIVLEYNEKPTIVDGLVAKTVDGGYSLLPQNQNQNDTSLNLLGKERRETVPLYASITSTKTLKWRIYVDKPGEKTIDVSYSFQNASIKSSLEMRVDDKVLTHNIIPTGKTIGEPNQDWVIDNFVSHKIGNINFEKPGFYEIETEIQPSKNDEIKFQWIWIK